MRKVWGWMIVFLFSIYIVQAVCVEPSDALKLTFDTELCPGVYEMERGIKILDSDISVTCQGTELVGAFIDSGFALISANNITITGCTIRDFESGFYISQSHRNTIFDVTTLNNSQAVTIIESYENVFDEMQGQSELIVTRSYYNSFNFPKPLQGTICIRNACNTAEKFDPCVNDDGYCSPSCPYERDNDCEPSALPEQVEEKPEVVQDNIDSVSSAMLDQLGILGKELEQAKQLLYWNKTKRVELNTTYYTISISAKDNAKNVKLVEYVPSTIKEQSVFEPPFEQVEDYAKIDVGSIKSGQTKKYSYRVEGQPTIDPITLLFVQLYNVLWTKTKEDSFTSVLGYIIATLLSLHALLVIYVRKRLHDLEVYITRQAEQGYTLEELEQRMIKLGWQEHHVKEAVMLAKETLFKKWLKKTASFVIRVLPYPIVVLFALRIQIPEFSIWWLRIGLVIVVLGMCWWLLGMIYYARSYFMAKAK